MEQIRGQVTLDLILCGSQDPVKNVNVTELLGISIHFTVISGGKVPANLSQSRVRLSKRQTSQK